MRLRPRPTTPDGPVPSLARGGHRVAADVPAGVAVGVQMGLQHAGELVVHGDLDAVDGAHVLCADACEISALDEADRARGDLPWRTVAPSAIPMEEGWLMPRVYRRVRTIAVSESTREAIGDDAFHLVEEELDRAELSVEA